MTETPFFSWQENHTLYSDAFNDIYYSRSGGLEEKEYVFLRGNSLPERWENKARFTIFELGFGAGLNFFATYHLWKKKFHQNGQLHFISLEKYPLPAEVVLHCLSIYPEYSQYMDSFSTRYTNLLPGLNRVISEKGFILDLYIGEAKDFFPEFYGKVDAWFLDGFSPAKNPELWSDEVFQFIRNHSADEATASTYTVAGQVRRGLESAGFQTMKIKGFGFKKEMLVAHRVLPEIPDTYKESYYAPGLSFSQKGERVTIIGAGFAGTSLANAFAKRGMRVQLVEEKESPGSGASGNPLGSFSLLLSAEKNPVYDLIFHGFSYLSRNLKDFQGEGKLSSYKRAGSLYVIGSLQERERYKRGIQAYSLNKEMAEILDPETCLERFGFKPAIGVLFFPESGYCSPKEFCEANLSVLNPE
ncbi:MAG: tRNA (5-methylaminomethyl-2-thiouridine)(34)-methyltransferase MnmD, partial [Leptospiraceae bacterium]|nr:tRNA (5-methylaminomethyl-2-thiouridine)(34)-methyltransferase MnmD [Leptospiraceae bacterium]